MAVDVVQRFSRAGDGFDRQPQGKEFLAEVFLLRAVQRSSVLALERIESLGISKHFHPVLFTHAFHLPGQFGQ